MKLPIPLLVGVLFASMLTAHGADNIITNPALHQGTPPQSIDPYAKVLLWPPNQRPTKAQLYEVPGFAVIQDFTGFAPRNTLAGGANIMAFSDPDRADLRVRFSSTSTSDSGRSNVSSAWWTSPNSAFLLAGNNGTTAAHTISAFLDFGNYDAGTFDPDAGPGVSAVAFTMTSAVRRYASVDSVDITYYSSTGKTLATQTIDSTRFIEDATSNYALLFAYRVATGVSIGSVQIDINIKAAADRDEQVLFSIDDIGYASPSIPVGTLPVSTAAALELVTLDYDSLVETRTEIHDGNGKIQPAYLRMITQAEALLTQAPFTVLQKDYVAASGNKRDYFDIGNYSWPNPNTPDGLPYIRRDGHRNPEANGPEFDKYAFNETINRVCLLSLAYFYTGDESYAAKAGDFLRAWFTDPVTGMNPNMNHAAALPGVMDGSFIGIINTVVLIDLVDAVKLLRLSSSWTLTDDQALQEWFEDYTDWLLTSDFGELERDMVNNHGTWYAAQVAAYSLYSGNLTDVAAMIVLGKAHIDYQVAADGSLPEELLRNRSLAYSRYGLRAFATLARAGELAGGPSNDLWSYTVPGSNRGLELAFEFIAPYLSGDEEWTWEQLPENGYGGAVQLLDWPSKVYPSPIIIFAAEQINPMTDPQASEPPFTTSQMVWLSGYLNFD